MQSISCLSACAGAIVLIGCGRVHTIATRPPSPPPPQYISTIARIKHSVVPVVCVQLPQPNIRNEPALTSVEGTAFFVRADGTFATADHVIRDLTAPKRPTACEQAAIYIPEGGWQPRAPNFSVQYFYFSAADCTRDEGFDIAVCRCARRIRDFVGRDPEPVTLETALQEDGTPAAFTGFPLQQILPITSRGFTAAYRDIRDDRGPRELVVDKTTWPGASGSPIYLENGMVIGILLQRGIGDGAGITIGRPASFIEGLLAQRQQGQ